MTSTASRAGRRSRIRDFAWPVFVAGLLAMASIQPAEAQTVELHRSFFRGWRYSIDSSKFRKLGARAEELRVVMKDYRVCISALNAYQAHVTAAKITGLASALLIGIPLFSQVRGQEWIDGYTPMVIVGGTLAISSLALEAAGSRRLKKAVRLYHNYKGYKGSVSIRPTVYASHRPRAGIAIGWRF